MDIVNNALELEECCPHAKDVTAVAVLDAHSIVEGTKEGKVRVFDLITGTCMRIIIQFKGVGCITVLSDGRFLGSYDGKAWIWNDQGTTKNCLMCI
jgi:WD40 repeat protein